MVTKAPRTVTEAVNQIIVIELRQRRIPHASAAKHLGIGRDTFSRRLTGPQGLTASELERLAPLLDSTPSDLLARAEALTHSEVAAS